VNEEVSRDMKLGFRRVENETICSHQGRYIRVEFCQSFTVTCHVLSVMSYHSWQWLRPGWKDVIV